MRWAARILQATKEYVLDGGTVRALRGVDLEVPAGDYVAVMGASGSGKSTLLNLIAGLDRPDAGTIAVQGRDLTGLGDRDLARLRNRQIGFIFQLHHLLPQCTVLENILVPTLAEPDRAAAASQRRRAEGLLKRVGLADRAGAFPGTLSGGERQRVAVALALIHQPPLLLADEPTGDLDADLAMDVMRLLSEIHAKGTTILVATHDANLVRDVGRRTILLKGGRVVEDRA